MSSWGFFFSPFLLIRLKFISSLNSLSPVMALINSMLARCKLQIFSSADVTRFCRPRSIFLTRTVRNLFAMGGKDYNLLKKRGGKKVSRRSFSTPVEAYPVFLSRVAKISTLTGSYRPPRIICPGYIFLSFCWSWKYYLPTSIYDLAPDHVWNHHPW